MESAAERRNRLVVLNSDNGSRGSGRVWLKYSIDLAACGVVMAAAAVAGVSLAEMASTGLPFEKIPEFLTSPLPDLQEPVRFLGRVNMPHGIPFQGGALAGAVAGAGGYMLARFGLPRG